jgi:hypothetical protein
MEWVCPMCRKVEKWPGAGLNQEKLECLLFSLHLVATSAPFPPHPSCGRKQERPPGRGNL